MELYNILILPFVFGLIGFMEPCSMGINIMFLSSIQQTTQVQRLKQATVFMLSRAFILAILGVSVAFIGSKIFTFQSGYFLVLGGIYILIGILMIFSIRLLGKLRNVSISRLLGVDIKEGSVKRLGIIAGLTIPACAIPLLSVLLGQSLLAGDITAGFISLFVFGMALTVPLIAFSFYDRGMNWLGSLAGKSQKFKKVGGVILVAVGVLTILSSFYWEQAI